MENLEEQLEQDLIKEVEYTSLNTNRLFIIKLYKTEHGASFDYDIIAPQEELDHQVQAEIEKLASSDFVLGRMLDVLGYEISDDCRKYIATPYFVTIVDKNMFSDEATNQEERLLDFETFVAQNNCEITDNL